MAVLLSKSKFQSGLQCLRRLWLEVHRPELATPLDPVTEALFAAGHEIGLVARQRFPGGVAIENAYYQHDQAVERTAELLKDSGVQALFEAAFLYDDVRVRVDILARGRRGRWKLIEVKSSSSLKPEHLTDIAIQRYVVEGAGLPVESTRLMRVDTAYVYDGKSLDPSSFLALEDATEEVAALLPTIPEVLAGQKAALAEPEEPGVEPGFQCASPYDCPFVAHCTASKPRYWVRRLPGLSRQRFQEFIGLGVEDIADIPDHIQLSDRQRRAVEATKTGRPWVSPDLGDELSCIEPPVSFLDFETIAPAIPRYGGTRPYQLAPFQWSLYTVGTDGRAIHDAFLHNADTDPRPAVAESLLSALRPDGPIVAYNASFEVECIRRLAEGVPDYADGLLGLLDRMVDLLAIVRKCYYHRDLLGSFSLKQLVPALVPDCAYSDLAIQDGAIASLEYLRMLSASDSAERQRIRADLLVYCERDTWAMVRVWEELGRLSKRGG